MMFFTSETSRNVLKAARDQIYSSGPDRLLYFHTGYFISRYAMVELRVSLLLAHATNVKDTNAFELLTQGMDVKTKVERFRKAAKGRIGKNLDARLGVLYDTMRPLRNLVVHACPATETATQETIGFATLNRVPSFTYGYKKERAATEMPMLEFFERAVWLDLFEKDLAAISKNLRGLETYEIDAPRSPLPKAPHQSPDHKEPRATLSRRERRRQRKGQPLRGKGAPR